MIYCANFFYFHIIDNIPINKIKLVANFVKYVLGKHNHFHILRLKFDKVQDQQMFEK